MIGTFLDANIFRHFLEFWGGGFLVLYILLITLKFLRPNLSLPRFPWLHLGYISSQIFYGLFLSFGQYVHWAANQFTKPMTVLPLPSDVPLPGLFWLFAPILRLRHGYFIDYMLSRYWLSFLWGLIVVLILYLFLRIVRRLQPHLLSALDLNLFVAGGLILGWPNILLFIVAVLAIFMLYVLWVTVRGWGRAPLYPAIILGFLLIFFFGGRIAPFFPIIELLKFARG